MVEGFRSSQSLNFNKIQFIAVLFLIINDAQINLIADQHFGTFDEAAEQRGHHAQHIVHSLSQVLVPLLVSLKRKISKSRCSEIHAEGDPIVVARYSLFSLAYSCHGSNIVLCNDSTTALR